MASCPQHIRKEIYRSFWVYLKEIQCNISIPMFIHRYIDDHYKGKFGIKHGDRTTEDETDIDLINRRCGWLLHLLCKQLVEKGEISRVSKNCYVINNKTGLELWKIHEYETQSDLRYHFNLQTRKWEELNYQISVKNTI